LSTYGGRHKTNSHTARKKKIEVCRKVLGERAAEPKAQPENKKKKRTSKTGGSYKPMVQGRAYFYISPQKTMAMLWPKRIEDKKGMSPFNVAPGGRHGTKNEKLKDFQEDLRNNGRKR